MMQAERASNPSWTTWIGVRSALLAGASALALGVVAAPAAAQPDVEAAAPIETGDAARRAPPALVTDAPAALEPDVAEALDAAIAREAEAEAVLEQGAAPLAAPVAAAAAIESDAPVAPAPVAAAVEPAASDAADAADDAVVEPASIAPQTAAADAATATALRAAARSAPAAVADFYAARDGAPFWTEAGAGRMSGALAAVAAADAHALPTARYDLAGLRRSADALAAGRLDAAERAQFELALWTSYLQLGSDLSSGAIDPRSVSRDMDVDVVRPEPSALVRRLASAPADADRVEALILSLAPQSADYVDLLDVYARMQDAVARGAWGAPIPIDGALRVGDGGSAIPHLRARLIALGELPRSHRRVYDRDSRELILDPAMEAAVRRFQQRNGLLVDGVIGRNTIAALNAAPAARVSQIAVNLERIRWGEVPASGRVIYVNIPDFHVEIRDDGQTIYRSRVVVGELEHQTPEFVDVMEYMVANPNWYVPFSIATEEFLPVLQRDPGALAARNIHVFTQGGARVDPYSVDWSAMSRGYFPFRMVQSSGPGNALGRVKFMFPNEHAVYLHDTPAQSLFGRSSRAYSHGCVRVADPDLMAEVLLSAQRSDAGAFYRRALSRSGEQYIHFDDPIPVHIVYRTAWVSPTGELQLRRDVYGRDALMADALEALGLDFTS